MTEQEFNNYLNELEQTVKSLKTDLKVAHIECRDRAFQVYESWRNSSQGQKWKEKFLKRCNYRCPECQKLINKNNSNIDHIRPRKLYPWLAWDVSNLWVLCINCNENKGSLDWESYLQVVAYKYGQTAVERMIKLLESSASEV